MNHSDKLVGAYEKASSLNSMYRKKLQKINMQEEMQVSKIQSAR